MNETHTTAEPGGANPNGRSWMIWPGIVIALLTGQVLLCMVAIYFAVTDSSHAVQPDYYHRAVHWDELQAARRASAALGWQTNWRIGQSTNVFGQREVILKLTDARGQPIPDADAALTVYHHARGNERQTASLIAAGDGDYIAELTMRDEGVWELELVVQRGEERFLDSEQHTVGSAPQRTPSWVR